MAFDNPDLRKRLLPSLDQVSKAMQKADQRDEKARDVRPLVSMLMRLSDADPRISGHLLTRQTAITSFDWVLEGGDDDAGREAATARLRSVIDHHLGRITEAPLYGAMAYRIEWTAQRGADGQATGQVPTVVQDFDPDEIERPTRRREDVRLLSWTGSAVTKTAVAEDDPTMVVVIDRQRAVQGGVLRTILIRAVLLGLTLQEWSRFLTKLKGLVSGQFRGGVPPKGDEERDTADEALQGLASDNYALHSDSLTFTLTKLVDGQGGSAFKDSKEALESDVAIGILGQANTSQLPSSGGSRAALEVLNLIRRDIHHADIRLAEQSASEQLVDRDYRINVDSTAARAPWRLRVTIEQDNDIEANARALAEAFDAMQGTGAGFLASEVYERLDMTPPDGTPDVLVRAAAPTLPGL